MSNTRYRPRLKKIFTDDKGIFKKSKDLPKRGRTFFKKGRDPKTAFITKNLNKLKKRKWRKNAFKRTSRRFTKFSQRNDTFLIQPKVFKFRRRYKRSLLYKRQLLALLSTVSLKNLQKIFFRGLKNKALFKSIVNSLELRLDIVLFRSNLVKTLYEARWLIFSGYVIVNNVVVRRLSYTLSVGDCVQLLLKGTWLLKRKSFFFHFLTFSLPPKFLETNYTIMSVVILSLPTTYGVKEISKLYSIFLGMEEVFLFQKKS